MNRKILSACLALAAAGGAAAQNLHPEIVVTNEYESKTVSVPKQALPMAFPDSLREFNYKFDYSVFDNPYEGSSEFNPYLVNITPARSERKSRSLWLRAGAGWTFHPEFKAVWTPVRKESSRLGIYADYKGYSGPYRTLAADLSSVRGSFRHGYDHAAKAGAVFSGFTDRHEFRAEVKYDGIFAGLDAESSLNTGGVSFGISSRAGASSALDYSVDASFEGGTDRSPEGVLGLADFNLGSRLVPHIPDLGFDLVADLGVRYLGCSGVFDARHVGVSINPKAVWKFGNLDLSAGVRLDMVSPAGNASGQYSRTGQIIYPDVRASYAFLDGALTAYASATGGARGVSWSELRGKNHFLRPSLMAGNVLENEIVRLDAAAGVRGRITQWFHYDLSAGYAFLSGTPAELVLLTAPSVFSQSVTYVDEGLFHADLGGSLDLEDISVDGVLSYRNASAAAAAPMVFPSPFSADVRISYCWAGRLDIWTGVRASLSRRSLVADYTGGTYAGTLEMKVPGYADISVGAEYALTRRWKVWGRVGNLLNADVRQLPVYARQGINFTAGICLEL